MANEKRIPLPPSLEKLPRYTITPAPGSTREDNDRRDIAFDVSSMEALRTKVRFGFANPDAIRSSGPRKKK